MGLKSVKLETLDLEVAGDMTHEVGEATLGLEPKAGTATTVMVKYVVVWKQVGGQWRLHRDIWNAKGA
jgi:ketosteroid isomerase-like protein